MKREQRVVLTLLKEIDTICTKNKIEYYLSPRLTLSGVTEQPFPENPLLGIVLMKVPDFQRFCQILEGQMPKDRALDSMKTNKWFPGFYLRYTDTRTLCYHIDAGRDYQYPGIGINIFPLKAVIPSRGLHLRNRIEETGWMQRCDSYPNRLTVGEFLSKCLIKIRCLGGSGRLGRNLFKKFCERQQDPNTKQYILKQKKRTVYYPADIFAKSTTVMLGGEALKVPAKTDKYLETTYGADYRKKAGLTYVPNPSLLVSARVSYEEYFAENPRPLKLVKQCRKLHKNQAKSRRQMEYFNQSWEYVGFCGTRKELGLDYAKKKEYIKNLYKNEDYMQLEVVFRPYTKMMQICLEQDEIFVEDEEVLEIYLQVLEKTGKLNLKKKIEQQWR